ncbi:hypothetical protein [Veillonella seminalis]|uniref:hypothetical protein n=1 Tax=Veillonella seminalis TaxID=1502943 RepID=UPI00402AA655
MIHIELNLFECLIFLVAFFMCFSSFKWANKLVQDEKENRKDIENKYKGVRPMPVTGKELALLEQLPERQRIKLLEERVIDLEQTLLELRDILILFNSLNADITKGGNVK